jgi:hypothetical protein
VRRGHGAPIAGGALIMVRLFLLQLEVLAPFDPQHTCIDKPYNQDENLQTRGH